jgi:hypothetical protein
VTRRLTAPATLRTPSESTAERYHGLELLRDRQLNRVGERLDRVSSQKNRVFDHRDLRRDAVRALSGEVIAYLSNRALCRLAYGYYVAGILTIRSVIGSSAAGTL